MAAEDERLSEHKLQSRIKLDSTRRRSLNRGQRTELGKQNRQEHEMFTGFLTEHKSVMRPQSAIKPILQRRQVIGSFKDFSKKKAEIESPEHVVSQSIEGDKNINLHKTVADGIATAITRRRVTQEKNDA